jgi:hypothetical protein
VQTDSANMARMAKHIVLGFPAAELTAERETTNLSS